MSTSHVTWPSRLPLSRWSVKKSTFRSTIIGLLAWLWVFEYGIGALLIGIKNYRDQKILAFLKWMSDEMGHEIMGNVVFGFHVPRTPS
jgi:hypothetical protein